MSTSFETNISAATLRSIVSEDLIRTYGKPDLDAAIDRGAIVFNEGATLAQRVIFRRIPQTDVAALMEALLHDGGSVLITRSAS